MTNELVFATHNMHKVEEVNLLMPNYKLLSLNDIQFFDEIEETGLTFYDNAKIKAEVVFSKYQRNVFADDSGLVIPSLNNEPGIYSSRYAGTGNSKDNIAKVLHKLENSNDRAAYFISVICLIFEGKTYFFEGTIHGTILREVQGENGFGYDPVFQPKGYDRSFAEFSSKEKNAISHRFNAIHKMKSFLAQEIEN